MNKQPASMIVSLLIPLAVLLIGVSISATIAVKKSPPLLTEVERGLLPPGFEVKLPMRGNIRCGST